MGKKVIRLTEADIENIVKKVIKEQSQSTPLFNLGGYLMSIGSGGKLFLSSERNGLVRPYADINGILSEFSVNPKTKSILNDGFINNVKFLDEKWSRISMDKRIIPMQYTGVDYRFIALIPDGFKGEGLPAIYTAGIKFVNKNDATNILETYKETTFEDGLRPYTYISVNRKGEKSRLGENYIYYLHLYPMGNPGYRYSTGGGGGETTKPISLSLSLQDVFKFNEINFKNESEAMTKLDEFAKEIQNGVEKYGDLFRRQMNAKLASKPILGYASIDGDPEGQVPKGSGYEPCSGQKRRDYNKCLSEARAKRVADILNEKFSSDNMINFKHQGMGETDLFDKGKKWPDYKSNETGKNRRIVLDLGEFRLKV
jgi:hypothetical protein